MNIPVICFILSLISKGILGIITSSCTTNTDCPNSKTCLKGSCQSPCSETCGPDAICIVIRHEAYCFCKDDTDECLPRKVSHSCVPECENNAICNVDIGYCECKAGYEGNPYKGCSKTCKTSAVCTSEESCLGGICRNPCDEECGVNAVCTIKNHVASCVCPKGYVGDPVEICRISDAPGDICKSCGTNAKCMIGGRSKICVCSSGFIGNPYKSCKKMCMSNTDCPADKICKHHVCENPCVDACGVNTECSVEKYKRKPICSCKEGFSGDPSRICTFALETRFGGAEDTEESLECHPKCGENAICDTKHGVCVCRENFIGNPYGQCRQKCKINSDCPTNSACSDSDCKNPCWTACGKSALCTVVNHEPLCRCPYGFSGDPFVVCRKIRVSTQPTIIDVDLCDTLKCGTNAECKVENNAEKCVCRTGYAGNPYENCRQICRTDSDCSHEKACKNNVCKHVCHENKCGINAVCTSQTHVGTCSCPDNYRGDPLKICFPNAKGVLRNPSRVPCLKCICKAITGNGNLFSCAEKSISFTYWAFAGEDLAGGEEFRTRNTTIDFITCMNDQICILNTINDYVSRVMHRLNDIDCDGQITCADYFAAHKFGLTAKFSDSNFNASEARSFDQCEDHGQKDVSQDWKPRKCSGPSYVEMMSR